MGEIQLNIGAKVTWKRKHVIQWYKRCDFSLTKDWYDFSWRPNMILFFSHLISRAKQGYDVQLPLTTGNVTQTKPQLLQY
jgi:hypothetical protein